MDCPSCGNANREGARFCDGCGRSLPAPAAVPEDQRTAEPEPSAAATPAPSDGQGLYRHTFVGREAELGTLYDAFAAAVAGQGALLMVVGEPGIGKTALCEQLAAHALARGGQALTGHCYEEGARSLPYLPFVEALRTYVLERDPERLRAELGTGAPDVARIVPELRARLGVAPGPSGDPETDRYRPLQSVTEFLHAIAAPSPNPSPSAEPRERGVEQYAQLPLSAGAAGGEGAGGRGLLLILEDLHDADRGTLDLLLHLARSLGRAGTPQAPAAGAGARLLVVGTYRDVEVDRAHPLSGALAELRRVGGFGRVPLRGLTPADVRLMLARIAEQQVPVSLAEAVYRQTEGNPLFVQEVLRYLAEEGAGAA